MSRTSIHCPHCGESTRIDLSMSVSTQKCDRCGVRFSAVDTGHTSSKEAQSREPPDWRRAEIGDWDEERDAAAGHAGFPRWAWGLVTAGFLGVAGTVIGLAMRRGDVVVPRPALAPLLAVEPKPDGADPAHEEFNYDRLKSRLMEARHAAETFLAAPDVESILPMVENRDRLESRLREYYTTGEGAGSLPLPPATLAPLDRQMYLDRLRSVIVFYQIPDQATRAVALHETAPGTWLVDWPSAVALNEMRLDEFVAHRESQPRLCRVFGWSDDYYNRAFIDDRRWLCIKLAHPNLKIPLFGYVLRTSPTGTSLAETRLPKSGPGRPILVKLKFPADAATDNQVEITEFLGTGWLLQSIDQEPGILPAPTASDAPPPPPEEAGDRPSNEEKK